MHSSLVRPRKPSPSICIALIATLSLLLSGWTCNAFFGFNSCQNEGPQPQIDSLSPSSIPSDVGAVPLTVDGSGFTPQSQIMWNGSALETTFVDSHHLQTTITQQTFDSFGGSAGSSVQISVRPEASVDNMGCPKSGNSSTLVLGID
jgi:IPT/TIG domain